MTQTSRKTDPLHELFIDQLRDIYSAERQLVRALPKLARAASSPELKKAFQEHLEETKGQVDRLGRVFESLDTPAVKRGKKCEAMEGLVAEGQEIIESDFEAATKDAALIAAGQKVEHYEIASYGTVCTWAKLMGHKDALAELSATLEEEKNADSLLTKLSATVNQAAQKAA